MYLLSPFLLGGVFTIISLNSGKVSEDALLNFFLFTTFSSTLGSAFVVSGTHLVVVAGVVVVCKVSFGGSNPVTTNG